MRYQTQERIVLQKIFSWPFLCLHQHPCICLGKICSKLHHHQASHLFPGSRAHKIFTPSNKVKRPMENQLGYNANLLLHLGFNLVPIYPFWFGGWVRWPLGNNCEQLHLISNNSTKTWINFLFFWGVGVCCQKNKSPGYSNIDVPGALTVRGTGLSLLNSREVHSIGSAFARWISTLVDKTSNLHFSGMICFQTTKHQGYTHACIKLANGSRVTQARVKAKNTLCRLVHI